MEKRRNQVSHDPKAQMFLSKCFSAVVEPAVAINMREPGV